MRMRTSIPALAATLVIAFGAAACGSGGSAASTKPSHVVETAYTATVNAKTAKVTFAESTKSASTSGSSESATVTGSGLMNLSNHSFELTVNAPSGGTVELLEAAGVEYIQVPPADRSQVPGNKPWESVDLNQVDEAAVGKSFSQLSSVNSDDPTQALSNLTEVSDSVVKDGAATIDGTVTTEYGVTVDLTKEAAKTRAKEGARAALAITQEAQELGTHTLPVTVWVDADGLVKQISEEVPIPAASTGATDGSGKATVTMTFSDFGAPAPLTPPPSSQVANITAQAVQQAKASGG
jgi:hypothetical protein